MRLLKRDEEGKLSLVEFSDHNIDHVPCYAMLSHVAGAEEATFKQLVSDTGKDKAGYQKLEFGAKQVAKDGLQYFWVNTCCIDESNSTEVAYATNSKFRRCQNASKCYVFLSDVSTTNLHQSWEAAFRSSEWFRRGGTLQDLIAPASVEFFSLEGNQLGSKSSLAQEIHEITGIAITALRGNPLTDFGVETRISWAANREWKCEEDEAYSLIGIFNISMSRIYGEGRENAFKRLRTAIYKSLDLPIELSETSPSPLSTVPFRRDVDFVDRRILHGCDTVLDHIKQSFVSAASTVALVGIGGMGKSQLAIEYCHRLRNRSPQCWIFWVHASTTERIEEGYREIAEQAKILGRQDPKENIIELVVRWLRHDMKRTWLLVLDSLDDDTVLSAPQPTAQPGGHSSDRSARFRRPLSAYLPQSDNGTVLITTRTKRVASMLVKPRDTIIVDPLIHNDAIALLTKKLDMLQTDNNLEELAGLLEYTPLAIVQAAAYIQSKQWRQYGVQQYTADFQKNEKWMRRLLKYEAGHLRRDREARNSIISTLQKSFDDIQEKCPSAADLLLLLSYPDPPEIPKDMLMVMNDAEGSGDQVALDELQSYLFVSVSEDRQTFEMPELVQLAAREWLKQRHPPRAP